MKRSIAALLLCLAFSSAYADDLAEASKAFDAKSYDIALRIYTRLANNGNPVAQFKLGEMVWYGEGTAPDLAKATELFKKSAAAGNADAANALNVIKQREARAADITYWTTTYNGADIRTATTCPAPVIPAVSKTNSEIRDVSASVAKWRECYNGAVDKLGAVLPAGKAIPADVATLMNEQEFAGTTARLDTLYTGIASEQSRSAKQTMEQYERWTEATQKYAAEHNKAVEGRNMAMKDEIEAMKRQFERGNIVMPPPRTTR